MLRCRGWVSRQTCLRPLSCKHSVPLMGLRGTAACRVVSLVASKRFTSSQTTLPSSCAEDTVGRPSPPVPLYAQLEARLPVSPISPNEALQLLACSFPAVHHSGVVAHLVCVLRGNTCCLDPLLCLSLIARLLSPTVPDGLCNFCNENHNRDCAATNAFSDERSAVHELQDTAVLVALRPLHETLVQCAMVSLQWQLEDSSPPCTQEHRATLSHLWDPPSSFSSASEAAAVKEGKNETHEAVALERGAALLLAFAAESSSLSRCDYRQSPRNRPSCGLLEGPRCTALVRSIVQRLFEKRENEKAEKAETLHTCGAEVTKASVPPTFRASSDPVDFDAEKETLLEESCEAAFCTAAQRCWYWSILVCRATPVLPSRALCSFAVDSLIDSLHVLHGVLRSLPEMDSTLPRPRTWPHQRSVAGAVEVLSWLLTRSLPPLNVPFDSDTHVVTMGKALVDSENCTTALRMAGEQRPPWTAELRNALLVLAEDFADVSVTLLEEGVSSVPLLSRGIAARERECRRLVTEMTAVAFRLALQFTAAPRRCIHPTELSEMTVGQRLLQSVLSLNLQVVCRALPDARKVTIDAERTDTAQMCTTRAACTKERPNGVPLLSIAEKTWCRLACVQHVVLLNMETVSDRRDTSNAGTSREEGRGKRAVAYERLLGLGAHHLAQCATNATATTNADDDCEASGEGELTKDVELAVRSDRTRPKDLCSLEFIFTWVKCWRAWLETCPEESRVGWLVAAVDESEHCMSTAGCEAPAHETAVTRKDDQGFLSNGEVVQKASATSQSTMKEDEVADQLTCIAAEKVTASVHQLSLWIAERWTAALRGSTDYHPLDVCACWSALSTSPRHSAASSSSAIFRVMQDAIVACERRLSWQCGDYVLHLRNASMRRGENSLLKGGEVRPPPHDTSRAAFMDWLCQWHPVFGPAFVSHVGLRLLCSDAAFTAEAEGGAMRPLPLSEETLAVLQRTLESSLSTELNYFQLWLVSAYVEWCEAAGIHIGWCNLCAEDCRECSSSFISSGSTVAITADGSGSAPWFILTVEGAPSSSGLPGGTDTAALVYLWCLGGGADGTARTAVCQQGAIDGGFDAVYGRSRCAVTPFCPDAMHTQRSRQHTAARTSPPSHGESTRVWLRQAMEEWRCRYALRLLLFVLQEEVLQRFATTSMEPPPSVRPAHAHCSADLTDRNSSRTGPPVLTAMEEGRSFLWHSAALQPLLCRATHRLLRRMDRAVTEVRNADEFSCFGLPRTVEEAREAASPLLRSRDGPTHTARTKPFVQWCVGRVVASLCEDSADDIPLIFSSAGASHRCHPEGPSAGGLFQHSPRSLSTQIAELEDVLQSLGLVALDTPVLACDSAKRSNDAAVEGRDGGIAVTASMIEEVRALMTTLFTTQTQAVLMSPRVLQLVDTLWRTCWSRLCCWSRDACVTDTPARSKSNSSTRESHWSSVGKDGEAAELNALVTCRVMLHATRHFHRLIAELVEYMWSVRPPALQEAALTGTWCLVATPTEVLERQLAVRDGVDDVDSLLVRRPSLHNTAGTSGTLRRKDEFCFSLSSLRTYEVLCLDRFGREERRRPCVWERWMQELASTDAVLQEHRLVHWKSRLVT